jgi:hypothetical protein
MSDRRYGYRLGSSIQFVKNAIISDSDSVSLSPLESLYTGGERFVFKQEESETDARLVDMPKR